MPDALGPITPSPGFRRIAPAENRPAQAQPGNVPFKGELSNLVSQVNEVQHQAADSITQAAAGGKDNLHEVMIAMNTAELSFKFLMETRNKLVDAYKEVMRMQL